MGLKICQSKPKPLRMPDALLPKADSLKFYRKPLSSILQVFQNTSALKLRSSGELQNRIALQSGVPTHLVKGENGNGKVPGVRQTQGMTAIMKRDG